MTNGSDELEWDRLKRLRDTMTAEELASLRARFDQDPNALSRDEAGILYLVTKDKIRVFELKAQRKRDKGSGSSDAQT